MIRVLRGLLILLCLAPGLSWAQAGLAGSKQVNLLRSVQGQWKLSCASNNDGDDYRQTQLVVSFTHFAFKESRFADGECRQLLGASSHAYRFILGDERILDDGVRAFAVEMIPVDETGVAAPVPRHNLLRYTGGRLYLGPTQVDSPRDAATRLDYSRVFTR